MDEEMKKFAEEFQKTMIIKLMRREEMPEDVILMVKCLIEAGCPWTSVLDGLKDFGEQMSLRDLLKDLPIEFEEE